VEKKAKRLAGRLAATKKNTAAERRAPARLEEGDPSVRKGRREN
jgi:hypothetical protein